jgi:hypothetical protein
VDLLRTVTAVYGVALAATVVGGLVMMAFYLRQVAIALADARAAMAQIVDESGPLADHLERLSDASGEWAEQLGVARPRLARVERMVAASTDGAPVVGRSTPRVPAPRRWRWVSRLFGG